MLLGVLVISPQACGGAGASGDGGATDSAANGGADAEVDGGGVDPGHDASGGRSDGGVVEDAAPIDPSLGPLIATDIATGFEFPWSVAFLPDDRFLVTERVGRMSIVAMDGSRVALSGLPSTIAVGGQGGLLDVVLDPGYATNRRIYFSFAESGAQGTSTAVARAELDAEGGRLVGAEVIFSQEPKVSGRNHFGGRLVVAADGEHLFVAAADRQTGDQRPQQTDNEIGKVLRIRLDGQVPADNPFSGEAGSGKIWSLGHRNIQGAALHPETGILWTHEHGPQGGDEVNVTVRGGNFGWPVVSYGCDYGEEPCRPIGGGTHAPRFIEPVADWGVPSTAPSGMTFYTADRIPEWGGRLLVGALKAQTVWILDPGPSERVVCLPVAGRRHCSEATVVTRIGERIRDVRQGPDGWVYLLTDSDNGRLIRISR